MALFKSRVGTSLRVGFLVKRNGALLTGQASNLTVEALSPTLGVSSGALTVTESTPKPGIYYVDVAAAFFAANGVGPYLLVAELAKPAPQPFDDVETFPLEITTRDLDDLATSFEVAGVQADTDDIQARLPTTLNAGRMRAHVESLGAGVIDATAAPNLDAAVSSRAQPGDAMALTSAERTAVANALLDLASAIDGVTPRAFLRLVGAALLGKVSGATSGTEVFRALDDGKDRITATVDDDGNRLAIVLDGS